MLFDLGFKDNSNELTIFNKSVSQIAKYIKTFSFNELWNGTSRGELIHSIDAEEATRQLNEFAAQAKTAGMTSDEYLGTLGTKVPTYFRSFIASTTEAERTTQNYLQHIEKCREAQIKNGEVIETVGIKSKLASASMTALSMAGNMLVGMAISAGIQLIVTGLDNIINRTEKLIEAGEQARQTISDINDAYTSKKDTVSSNKDRYIELSAGVDIKTNQNLSLATEDYEEFLNITNQIAETFPSLVTGYDAQGNALLSLSGNADETTTTLEKLLEQERQLADFKISQNLQTAFDGTIAQIGVLQDEIDGLNNKLSDYEGIKKALDTDSKYTLSEMGIDSDDKSYAYIDMFSADTDEVARDQMLRIQESFVKAANEVGLQDVISQSLDGNAFNGTDLGMRWTADLSALTQDQLIAFTDAYKAALTESGIDISEAYKDALLLKQQDTKEIQANWNSSVSSLITSMSVYDGYNELGDEVKQAINTGIGNIDPIKEWMDENGKIQAPSNIRAYLREKFLDPITNALDGAETEEAKEKINSAISELFSLNTSDINVVDYKKQVMNLVSQIVGDGNDKESIIARTNFRVAYGITYIDEDGKEVWAIDDITKKISEKTGLSDTKLHNEISQEDLNYVYNMIVQGNFDFEETGNWDAFVAWIDKIKGIADEVELEPVTFSSILADNSDDGISKKVDDFQSNISTIQSALDSLRSGEDVNFTDLTQQFTELSGQTDNLEDALVSLKSKELGNVISDIFKSAKENGLSSSEMDNATEFIQNLIRESNISNAELPNVKNAVISALMSSAVDAIDRKMIGDSVDNLFKDIDISPLQNLSKQMTELKNNAQEIQNRISLNDSLGIKNAKSDYRALIDNSKEQVRNLQIQNDELQKSLVGLNKNDDAYSSITDKIQSNVDAINSARQAQQEWNDTVAQLDYQPLEGLTDYNKAKETRNAGDNYLDMLSAAKEAQEARNKGLVGTDDFKTVAKMFSPNGMDDYQNWDENYSKIQRYFTEGDTGAKNFLNDLSQITRETENGTIALAEFDDSTKTWSYNIDDVQASADALGISFEAFLAIMGRLQDYGFSNDFFSSIEDGQDHLGGLYFELAQAETELIRLQEERDNGNATVTDTVLRSQEAKIESIKSSILSTQDLIDQLMNRQLSDYEAETQSALRTAQSMIEKMNESDNEVTKRRIQNDLEIFAEEYGITLQYDVNTGELLGLSQSNQEILQEAMDKDPIEIKYQTPDLTNRPQVSPEKMWEADWNEVQPDEYATVYSSAYSNKDETKTVVVTPILPDGNVLDEESLRGYADQLLNGEEIDAEVHLATFEGKDSVQQAKNYSDALHAVQEAYYSEDEELQSLISSLGEYNKAQLEGIQLADGSYDETYAEAEKSIDNILSTLGLSTDQASALYTVLEQMGLIQPSVEYEADTSNVDEANQEIENSEPTVEVKAELSSSDLAKAAADAKSRIEGKYDSYQINIDYSDIEDADNRLFLINNELARLEQFKATPNIDSSNIEDANTIIQYLLEQKQQLESSTPMNVSVDESEIPEIEQTITCDTTEVDQAKNAIQELRDNCIDPIVLEVKDKGSEYIQSIDESIQKIDGENVAVDFSVGTNLLSDKISSINEEINNIPDGESTLSANDQASNIISDATSLLNIFDSIDPTANLKAYDGASSIINSVNNSLNALDGKVANVTIHTTRTGEVSGGLTGNFASGTLVARASGTAYNMLNLRAHASGTDVSIKRDEVALVNELGNEALIRDGKLYEIPGGTHMQSLKRGDVVINAAQWEEIKKYGSTNTFAGKAYASGTSWQKPSLNAYANNTGAFASPSSASSNNTTTSQNTSAVKASTKATKENTKATKDASDSYDWIAVKLDRLGEKYDRYIQKAENATTELKNVLKTGSNDYYQKAISTINEQIKANEQGSKRYMMAAESFNLSSSLKKKVQKGTIDLNKYDDDTKEKIENYKTYYDKAIECQDAVDELKAKQVELAQTKLDNVVNYYERMVDLSDAIKDNADAVVEFNKMRGKSINATDASSDRVQYKNQLSAEAKNQKYLEAARAQYASELKKQMDAKIITKYSDAWYEAQNQLKEYDKAIVESKTAQLEYAEAIDALTTNKLQYITDNLTRIGEKLKSSLDLLEKRKGTLTEADYTKQIGNNNNQIVALSNQRDNLFAQQKQYEYGSEKYEELAEKIADVDNEILGLLSDNEDLKDSINEVRWKSFNDGIKAINSTIEEIEFLKDQISEDALLDDNGIMTADGYSFLSLINQGYKESQQLVADYQMGIKKLNAAYANGNYNQSEYNDLLNEYLSEIRNGVSQVEDYKNAIIDLYKQQAEAQNDALQSTIDKRKEALRKKKEYYDYDRTIRDKTKDINALKAQAAALEGVSTQAGKARLAQIKAQLAEAEDDLADTKYEHTIDLRLEGYDQMKEDADDALDKLLKDLTTNADLQKQVVDEMLSSIVDKYDIAYGKINEIIANTGLKLSDKTVDDLNKTAASDVLDSASKSSSNTITTSTSPSPAASNVNTSKITVGNSTTQSIENSISNGTANKIVTLESSGAKNDANNNSTLKATSIKLSATNLSLAAGKKQTLSVSATPTGATVSYMWSSNKPEVATVSGGKVQAIAKGTATITCKDNISGKSATCKVTVSASSAAASSSSSAGLVSSLSGTYKQGSKGSAVGKIQKALNALGYTDNSGKKLAVDNVFGTKTKQAVVKFQKAMKLSADGVVGSNTKAAFKKKGYAKGTKFVPQTSQYLTDENGQEIIITKDGVFRTLNRGDAVVPNNLAENLFEWGKMNPKDISASYNCPTIMPSKRDVQIVNHYDSLINIEGNVDQDAVTILRKMIPEITDSVTQKLTKEFSMTVSGKKGYR